MDAMSGGSPRVGRSPLGLPIGGVPAGVVAGAALASAVTAALVAARIGGRDGARRDEVRALLPGDDLLPDADRISTRAVTIAAPPAAVWPWLVQMGYGRAGWYAVDAVERALGVGDFLTGGSARQVVPALQDLAVGDRVPLSEHAHLVVARLEAPRALVLVLPQGPLAWVWAFVLRDAPDGGTRLLVRTRVAARQRRWRPALPPLDVGHLVMETVQLQTLRRRVERTAGDAEAGARLDDRDGPRRTG